MSSSPQGLCILLIDDELAIREVVGEALRAEGHEVRVARDGRSALQRLREEPPPDVIVLDLAMPAMSGWEFREVQRADPRLAAIPVVVVSASLEECPCLAALGAECVAKPIDLPSLLAAIARARVQDGQPRPTAVE